jgi:hypothetical protein
MEKNKWTIKTDGKFIKGFLIFLFVWLIFNTLGWLTGDSNFSSLKLTLSSFGFSFLFMVLFENTGHSVLGFPPIQFYYRSGKKTKFSPSGLPLFLNGTYLVLAAFILIYSIWINDSALWIWQDMWSIAKYLKYICILLIVWEIIKFSISYIKNRKDFLHIGLEDSIKWFDNESGHNELSINDISKINLSSENNSKSKEIQIIKFHMKSGGCHVLNLSKMSLMPFSRRIIEELKTNYITVVKIVNTT